MSVNEKKSIGISISDRNIEVLELVKKGDDFDISHIGRKEFSFNIVESGRVINPKLLKSSLLSCLDDASIIIKETSNINFAIPEAQIYTHVFKTELKNKDEKSIVENELLNIIPLQRKNLLFKYKKNKINHSSNQFDFLSISIDKKVFSEWINFFKSSGIKINNFYLESLASFYGLFLDSPEAPCVLLDIGSRTSNLSVFMNKELKYSYAIRIGGDYFTKKISEGLKINLEKAEELKFNYGLRHPANKSYNEIFLKALEHLKIEVQRNLDYFKKTYLDNNNTIGNLFLLGGSSKILGIKDYFEYLDIFENVKIGEAFVDLDGKTEFIEALGLAMSFFSSKEKDFVFKLGEGKRKLNISSDIKKNIKNKLIRGETSKFLEVSPLISLFLKYFLVFCLSFLFFFLITTSFSNNNKTPENNIQELELSVPEIIEPEIEEIKVNKIRIRSTVSFLNIREGAGTNYAVIGKAKANEEYILLLEEGDWQKIELKDKLWGWVNKNFTEIIE